MQTTPHKKKEVGAKENHSLTGKSWTMQTAKTPETTVVSYIHVIYSIYVIIMVSTQQFCEKIAGTTSKASGLGIPDASSRSEDKFIASTKVTIPLW